MTTHEPGGADTNRATLNTRANSLAARANQAWIEARDPDTGFSPFAHQRHAFEEGWETGYKARDEEVARDVALIKAEALAKALQGHHPTTVMAVASGVTCQCGYWNGNERPGVDRPAGAQGRDGLDWHRAQVVAALFSGGEE